MALVRAGSLAETLNGVEERLFLGKSIGAKEGREAALWIAARQGLPGAYRGMFAPFDNEGRDGVRLFTGERVTNAAARHIMGEEAMRALRRLKVAGKARAALNKAAEAIRLPDVGDRSPKPQDGLVHWMWPWRAGTYCCGACSVALWRNMLAGGFDRQEERMAVGLGCLRRCRKSDGMWRVFPFWYTLLALSEMTIGAAVEEMRFAASRCERAAQRGGDGNVYASRRKHLARRILSLI